MTTEPTPAKVRLSDQLGHDAPALDRATEVPEEVQIALANMLHAQFELGVVAGKHGRKSVTAKHCAPTADALKALVREIRAALDAAAGERDGLMQTVRDEIDENLRLRELGGALPDENITAMTERVIRELEAQRIYASVLCKAVDAATDFAGAVAGGASWWDDVWSDHEAALDKARDGITAAACGPNEKGNRPA